ncbi:unnamed protein product [Symbiodinium sp. CCMP2592]|nr:unnamed protein product [Symbiodinium sp. CCMP2592]
MQSAIGPPCVVGARSRSTTRRTASSSRPTCKGHQKGARQVQANSSTASKAGTTAPFSASALQVQQGKAGQSTVRRVAAEPLLFDMSDLEDPFPHEPNYVCMIAVTAPQSFAMDAQDDDDQWTLPLDDYAVLDLVPSASKVVVADRVKVTGAENGLRKALEETWEARHILYAHSQHEPIDEQSLKSVPQQSTCSALGLCVCMGRGLEADCFAQKLRAFIRPLAWVKRRKRDKVTKQFTEAPHPKPHLRQLLDRAELEATLVCHFVSSEMTT